MTSSTAATRAAVAYATDEQYTNTVYKYIVLVVAVLYPKRPKQLKVDKEEVEKIGEKKRKQIQNWL